MQKLEESLMNELCDLAGVPVHESEIVEVDDTEGVIKALRDTDYRDKDSFFKMIQLLKGLAVASENDKTAKAYMDKVSDALTSIGGKTESMDLGESKLDKELEKRLLAYVKKHGLKTKGEVMSAMIKMAPKWMEEIGYSVVVGDKLGKIGESVDLELVDVDPELFESILKGYSDSELLDMMRIFYPDDKNESSLTAKVKEMKSAPESAQKQFVKFVESVKRIGGLFIKAMDNEKKLLKKRGHSGSLF